MKMKMKTHTTQLNLPDRKSLKHHRHLPNFYFPQQPSFEQDLTHAPT